MWTKTRCGVGLVWLGVIVASAVAAAGDVPRAVLPDEPAAGFRAPDATFDVPGVERIDAAVFDPDGRTVWLWGFRAAGVDDADAGAAGNDNPAAARQRWLDREPVVLGFDTATGEPTGRLESPAGQLAEPGAEAHADGLVMISRDFIDRGMNRSGATPTAMDWRVEFWHLAGEPRRQVLVTGVHYDKKLPEGSKAQAVLVTAARRPDGVPVWLSGGAKNLTGPHQWLQEYDQNGRPAGPVVAWFPPDPRQRVRALWISGDTLCLRHGDPMRPQRLDLWKYDDAGWQPDTSFTAAGNLALGTDGVDPSGRVVWFSLIRSADHNPQVLQRYRYHLATREMHGPYTVDDGGMTTNPRVAFSADGARQLRIGWPPLDPDAVAPRAPVLVVTDLPAADAAD